MSVIQYESKIKLLLNKFIQQNCKIESDHYYKLLDQISGKNTTAKVNLIELTIFTEWVEEAVAVWHLNKWTPTTLVTSFTLNLTALLCQNEYKFCLLNKGNFYIRLIEVLKARNTEAAPCIHLAYINFLSLILDHTSGIEWMMASKFWEDILKFSLISDNVYIIRESRNFMKKLLEACIMWDEEFCKNVVKRIMTPLSENAYKSISLGMEYNDETMYRDLSPTLQLIGTVLEYFLENYRFGHKKFTVIIIFLENFNLEHRVSDILILNLNKYFMFDLGRIMFILQFLEIYIKISKGDENMEHIINSVERIIEIYNENVSKGNFENVIKFCYFGQFYWNLIAARIPYTLLSNVELSWFVNDISMIPLSSLAQLPLRYFYGDDVFAILKKDPMRKDFYLRITTMFRPEAVRLGIIWKDFLLKHPNLFQLGEQSLIYLLKCKQYFQREKVAVIVQFLLYILKDVMEALTKNLSSVIEFCSKETRFFILLFEATSVFIEDYHITWKDNFVVLDLFGITMNLLLISIWTTKTVVKMIKLLKTCFEYYLSPNLAVLDESSNLNTEILKKLISSKLKESDLQVRKSALELIMSISQISKNKFPCLSKVLIDSDLPEIVVEMLTNDRDKLVRATAIRCLQEIMEVEEVWNNSLVCHNLLAKMKRILIMEPEGAVRIEAVTFLYKACKFKRIPQNQFKKVYKTMVHVSIKDTHWAVKLCSLSFWELVITISLETQGMTDGIFPKIVFSKQKRKIIKLTDHEIQTRLRNVLGALSRNGCLGVLAFLANISYDVEVTKAATKVINDFTVLLGKYHISLSKDTPDPAEAIERIFSRMLKSPNEAPYYLKFDSSDDEDEDEEIKNSAHIYNYNVIITPTEFLRIAQQDFEVNNRAKTWLNGVEDLEPLLDNMLKTFDYDNGCDENSSVSNPKSLL